MYTSIVKKWSKAINFVVVVVGGGGVFVVIVIVPYRKIGNCKPADDYQSEIEFSFFYLIKSTYSQLFWGEFISEYCQLPQWWP